MAEAIERTLLQYLPAIFHKPPSQAHEISLRDYLAPFEKVFQEFDLLLATLDNYVTPQLTPSEEFLPWLASWVALILETDWSESQKRRIIEEAVELYRWRGTVYGLKRFLQLYANVEMEMVEIEEAAWPAGMQIGVASRIGARQPAAESLPVAGEIGRTQHDAYVVNTTTPEAQPLQVYYASKQVVKVDLEKEGVRMWYRTPGEEAVVDTFHPRPQNGDDSPNIVFHGERVDYEYQHAAAQDTTQPVVMDYYGGTFLIDQIRLPYRFIVHLRLPADELQKIEDPVSDTELVRIRRVLDLEKPAHTEYYLKLSPAAESTPIHWMQIEVRSSVGLDTTVA